MWVSWCSSPFKNIPFPQPQKGVLSNIRPMELSLQPAVVLQGELAIDLCLGNIADIGGHESMLKKRDLTERTLHVLLVFRGFFLRH